MPSELQVSTMEEGFRIRNNLKNRFIFQRDATNTCGQPVVTAAENQTWNETSLQTVNDPQLYYEFTNFGERLAPIYDLNSTNETDHHAVKLLQDNESM